MHLNGLDQFALRRDLGVGFLGFKHPIQEPDNETIRQQYERADQTRPMPEMPELNWNQLAVAKIMSNSAQRCCM